MGRPDQGAGIMHYPGISRQTRKRDRLSHLPENQSYGCGWIRCLSVAVCHMHPVESNYTSIYGKKHLIYKKAALCASALATSLVSFRPHRIPALGHLPRLLSHILRTPLPASALSSCHRPPVSFLLHLLRHQDHRVPPDVFIYEVPLRLLEFLVEVPNMDVRRNSCIHL